MGAGEEDLASPLRWNEIPKGAVSRGQPLGSFLLCGEAGLSKVAKTDSGTENTDWVRSQGA